ncbi:hypothetical protein ACA910_017381 [Epithemia clementina (nom. ined.)]
MPAPRSSSTKPTTKKAKSADEGGSSTGAKTKGDSSPTAAAAQPPPTGNNNNSNTNPKTVLEKIIYAIRQHPNPTHNGVSRPAISKYLKAELDCDNASAIKKALKQGVQKGDLIQNGQSFLVAGDPTISPPPDETVQMTTIKAGDDTEDAAKTGDTVIVKYRGTLDDGSVFDSASSFEFVLGAGEVIKGWDQGVAGMMIGEERSLVVPPKLGYGKKGASPEIPPNATLHFTVTLKKIIRTE